MLATISRTSPLALLLLCTACTGQPWTLSQSSDAIWVRWYPDESSILAANQVARMHCRSWGKSAQLATDLRDGSAEIAQYFCHPGGGPPD